MEGKTILLIDDDLTLSDMYRERLKMEGYNVVTVPTGEEGLELAGQSVPNLIMLDIMMPGIGGWETLKRLKHNPRTATIPVVIVTALVQETVKQQGAQLGAAATFVKSETTPAEVIEAVNKMMGRIPQP